jgi:copper resistance protein C
MVVKRTLGVVLALALLAEASPSFAHAFLDRAIPAVGSAVPASPPALSLRFTEAVEPLFSTIALEDAQGTAVALPKPHAEDGGRTLVVTVPPLRPGTYTVHWHATSVDTHKTEGQFKFTVGG